ncbi:MAG: aldehyde dehydrogenase family protein [FCB group bacterium]|jgi:aldehyde dehydrogenase (NAD+)|nr:aldehyde dehydrogenase family protein [FCB group bacterium]
MGLKLDAATPPGAASDARPTVEALRRSFDKRLTAPVSFRREQLRALGRAIESREQDLLDALHEDLRKPPMEAYASELGFVQSDIAHTLRHLDRWTRPRRASTPLVAWPGRSRVMPEPFGVALIVGPWNYPFQLLLSPLVAALAAGNVACLKPSELAPNTSATVARLVRDTFAPDYVAVVEGGQVVSEALLHERFDYIFFTGSTTVGRAVMRAAAEHLTPVTLELGGKSPCIVCADADLEVSARRIVWGKFMNAGQTCVAPDFILADRRIKAPLLEAIQRAIRQFYGDSPRDSADYGRIVNDRHFARIVGYLPQGRIVQGGDHDVRDRFIAPTVMVDVDPAAPVMREEIFGPVLPVLEFEEIEDALALLRDRPKPLALYLFTRDRAVEEIVSAQTSSGGMCVNDVISHMLGKDVPFGGVGESGMGAYHGKAGFDTFTHYKPVLRRAWTPDFSLRYPPFKLSRRWLKFIYNWLMG